MSGYVAGIDGGGTRSCALVLNPEGLEVGYAEGPPALVRADRPQTAAEAVVAVVHSATEAGDIPLPLAGVWAGLAGAGREGARQMVESLLQQHRLAGTIRVGTDVEAAFHDAFGSGPGVMLVAGTSSVAMGVAEDGRRKRAGGWGRVMGDEGSGYQIGIDALHAVAQACDKRAPRTELKDVFLGLLGLSQPEELVPWAESATKADIAALAPHVARLGRDGDGAARGVVERALGELRRQLWAVINTLSPWSEPPLVALTGGLIVPGGPLRRGMEGVVMGVGGRIFREPVSPERGAARLALDLVR